MNQAIDYGQMARMLMMNPQMVGDVVRGPNSWFRGEVPGSPILGPGAGRGRSQPEAYDGYSIGQLKGFMNNPRHGVPFTQAFDKLSLPERLKFIEMMNKGNLPDFP